MQRRWKGIKSTAHTYFSYPAISFGGNNLHPYLSCHPTAYVRSQNLLRANIPGRRARPVPLHSGFFCLCRHSFLHIPRKQSFMQRRWKGIKSTAHTYFSYPAISFGGNNLHPYLSCHPTAYVRSQNLLRANIPSRRARPVPFHSGFFCLPMPAVSSAHVP